MQVYNRVSTRSGTTLLYEVYYELPTVAGSALTNISKLLPAFVVGDEFDGLCVHHHLCEGNQVRVTGQLIRAATDEHVWAEKYDRDLTDIFAVQDELTQEIISALKIKLTPETKERLVRKNTINQEAYDLFLRAPGASERARRKQSARSG